MTGVIPIAVALVSAAGVIAGSLVVATTRSTRSGIVTLLELWTAAGLLRLSADATWMSLGTAAAIVALRKIVTLVGIARNP